MGQNNSYKEIFEDKKKEFKEQRDKDIENGRLSGELMMSMFISITGQNPFSGEPHVDENGNIIGPQLGARRYPDSKRFSTKLKKNQKELGENLLILQEIFPQMDDEDKKRHEEFVDERNKLIREYAGIDEDEENIAIKEDDIDDLDELEKKIEELEEEYKSVIKTKENISEEINDIMSEPLCKCNFDMITEEDVQDSGLTVREQNLIDAMLDY